MNIDVTNYTHRLLASFVIEAETPLTIGSGEKDIISDSLVATDINGLPYIPGSSISGVVRHFFTDTEKAKNTFGFQEQEKGHGSNIIFTEGKLINYDGNVMDGLAPEVGEQCKRDYSQLPIRQHARINGKGTVADMGKFDEQVVYAGSRFYFEIEIVADPDKTSILKEVINTISNKTFRIGSGSRSGFGKIRVIEAKQVILNLTDDGDRELYLNKPSELNSSKNWSGWKKDAEVANTDIDMDAWTEYNVTLSPDSFFLFGSGFGDENGDADMTAVRSAKVVWKNGTSGELKTNCVLIPASSLKGALRHRVAYHYNRNKGFFVGNTEATEADENPAVEAIFGSNDDKQLKRGNALFSDIIKVEHNVKQKLINHVSIDRFTGGAIDGALFTEQADYGAGETFETSILVNTKTLEDKDYTEAFESTLKDLCNGMLPLGGGVNRGNGIFTGTVTKNGEELK